MKTLPVPLTILGVALNLIAILRRLVHELALADPLLPPTAQGDAQTSFTGPFACVHSAFV